MNNIETFNDVQLQQYLVKHNLTISGLFNYQISSIYNCYSNVLFEYVVWRYSYNKFENCQFIDCSVNNIIIRNATFINVIFKNCDFNEV